MAADLSYSGYGSITRIIIQLTAWAAYVYDRGEMVDTAQILAHTVEYIYVPLDGIHPLTDAEVGRLARTLIPELALLIEELRQGYIDANPPLVK